MNPDKNRASPPGNSPGTACCNIQVLKDTAWHALNADEIYALLASSPQGLDTHEVRARNQKYGSNTLPSKKPPAPWEVVLRQFKSPLIYILLVAALISFGIGEITDGTFILAVICVNAIIGTIQEWKAEKSAHALQALLHITAIVHRDGHPITIDAADLVPGDVVLLSEGNRVPADIRLLHEYSLKVDESLLSGESLPVEKDTVTIPEETPFMARWNMAYAGSTVVSGRGEGVVTATGLLTEVGKIARSVVLTDPVKPPLLIRMEKFSQRIGFFVIAAGILIAVIALSRGMPSIEVFFIVVALAVSAIPEGLPVSITVALSLGVSRMAARNVIVRKLTAVEALGSCTYIASDKTGTLTVNAQTLRLVEFPDGHPFTITGEGYDGDGEVVTESAGNSVAEDRGRLLNFAALGIICNSAELRRSGRGWVHQGDPIDIAFLAYGYKLGLEPDEVRRRIFVIGEIPFEAEFRYAATFYKEGSRNRIVVKGAVEMILPMCWGQSSGQGTSPLDAPLMMELALELAEQGFRVIALAEGDLHPQPDKPAPDRADLHSLMFVGFACFIDPVRPEAAEAIQTCRQAGIRVAMVTGDHPATALAIARELGIAKSPEQLITGTELETFRDLERPEAIKKLENISVFARVVPLQKLAIVKNLQRLGHYVAVTGDGVNDTPALKQANIGVAMGSGTDLAKDTASIIITEDSFSSIVDGIYEGRVTYDNIRKVTYLLISTGFAEVVLFMLALGAGLPLPLLAVQLLWLNLVTNGIQDVALAFEGGESGVMKRKPRLPQESIINRRMAEETIVSGLYIGISAFVVWGFLIGAGYEENTARNLLLLLMVLLENCHVFNCRSEYISAFHVPLARNRFLILGVIAAQGIHILSMYIPFMQNALGVSPVTFDEWFLLLGISLGVIAVMELYKFVGKFRSNETSGAVPVQGI
ncbi:MAG: HAD-IC family P-type ATPase [Methanoregula sp.]|nr:MAG: HAD-IC family P-type ATPase [Methanoregula sp.]